MAVSENLSANHKGKGPQRHQPQGREVLEVILQILKFLGITSVVGALGLYLAFIGFLPELALEGISDKSPTFNSQSKLIVRNIGKIPAINLEADIENFRLFIAEQNIRIGNGTIKGGPAVARRLAGGESAEFTITPGMVFSGPYRFSEFDYTLVLSYQAKLLFLSKSFQKRWAVKLVSRTDGYHWEIQII